MGRDNEAEEPAADKVVVDLQCRVFACIFESLGDENRVRGRRCQLGRELEDQQWTSWWSRCGNYLSFESELRYTKLPLKGFCLVYVNLYEFRNELEQVGGA